MNWLRRIIVRSTGIRTHTLGFGFPDAPGARRNGAANAPLNDPLKFRKAYHGKL